MMHQCELSLRAWDPDGTGVSREAVLSRLKVDDGRYKAVGNGGWWKTIRIIVLDLAADAFWDREQPSLALGDAFRAGQIAFADHLATVPRESVDALRQSGVELNVYLDAWIDQDLFDLQWEAKLLGELGRLGLNLEIVTND
jgi:hypothetical protein